MSNTITLSDTLAVWPYPRRINPHYETVSLESATWFRGFHAFNSCSQRAFDSCDFDLLTALTYPSLSKEHLRVASDTMNAFFVFDEYTDTLPGDSVRVLADITMDAMLHPEKPRPATESILGEITRQFWLNALKCSTLTFQRHFKREWQLYVDSVVEEARDRDHTRFRTVEEHLALRHFTAGILPSLVMTELGLNIPQDVYDNTSLVDLRNTISDIVALDNDMLSYNKEQAVGDDLHSIVTLIMHEHGLDLPSALVHGEALHAAMVRHILDDLLPTLQALDVPLAVAADLAVYIGGMLEWPRGNVCWHFESTRYFGSDGARVQRERVVELYPRCCVSALRA
ncbi:terpenoid synthase [Epithele typhae]|uniref:terpenoid synthase n=1 Tax=Epithele typhae TaxID=378194 RepID=UPI0020072A33|nr:terpenoid synthase [Epithele typhae]KAH9923432.1 terpenoid synthase [Epithele typhae]